MTLEMIETIRKLAESHDFKGVPIPQLCKMAARYAWLNEKFDMIVRLNDNANTGVPGHQGASTLRLKCGEPLDRWIDEKIVQERPAAAAGSPK